MYVMVSGPPGSGKSTLARPIAEQLELPLIAKDAIKEALMDVLGYPTSVQQSRTLGRAAVMAMLNVAESSTAGAVLDSTFFAYAFPRLESLPGPLVEVHCRCPRFNEQNANPIGIARHIVVDTTREVDIAEVVRQIRRLAD